LECTVNRVGDSWFDQTPRTGHDTRISDLALFADLGIKSLRYPALWERISPETPDIGDFSWTDERLAEIRRLGMNPILTLCHHGSGPKYTSLLEHSFAPGLARHAARVAAHYPWVEDWTPVNEPLTTARFSALYGFWYPHTRDEGAFLTALLNEIDATRLSMREIRRVNPAARLIQTDDLGYCHATPPLQAEADFQNERRWLGWDLLCGMVVPGHPLWERFVACGLDERVRITADDPCPPDVIGVNHYLASERLLDHRIERHADRAIADRAVGHSRGIPHVDVDAIRSVRPGVIGLPKLLQQAWERYGRPLAVTECHNGATREDQVRWFVEVWNGVEELRASGVDVRAVTAWSLLGSHDWNRMVTRFIGHYEVGVFDVRSGRPRPTALAGVLKDLTAGNTPKAVGLEQPGWWRRPSRFRDAAPSLTPSYDVGRPRSDLGPVRPLLIVGSDGPLIRLLVRACEARGLHYLRATSFGAMERAIRTVSPWAVIDAHDWAGICEGSVIPGWETERQDVPSVDHFAPPEDLVALCAELDVPSAVFTAASEFEEVEERLLATGRGAVLLACTEKVFTPWDRTCFAVRSIDALDCGLPVAAARDLLWDGIYGPDLVDSVLDLMMDGVRGAVSFLPADRWSEAEFVHRLAEVAQCDPDLVCVSRRASGTAQAPATEPNLGRLLPPGETTLERFVREARAARREGVAAVGRREDEVRLEAAE
jgi:dTDP-4-dehydrorhamnose reductase